MDSLEDLLKSVLPTQKKVKKPSRENDIHHLIKGKYLDKAKTVFRVRKRHSNITKETLPDLVLSYFDIFEFDFAKTLFIDTETTGLAGGTGTIAFLIGLGYFDRNDFILEQYFLKELASESILLETINDIFSNYKYFVSFNGKSFDIPLIRTRFIMNEIKTKLINKPNLDLLHLSRRLWSNVLPSCALQDLEREVLACYRDGSSDIPGQQIPFEYSNYLETRDADNMVKVIYHNQQDIINMLYLLNKISSLLKEPLETITNYRISLSGIGKLYEQYGNLSNAEKYYLKVLEEYPNHTRVNRQISFLYKRMKNWLKAVKIWEKEAEKSKLYALIELAKWEEHHTKVYEKALDYTKQALKLVKTHYLVDYNQIEKLEHRKKRLKRKLASKS